MSSQPLELKSKILRAGAGAGKTTTLVSELIEFYSHFSAHHKREPKVVLTTFTRKATHELKERLLAKAIELNNQKLVEFMSKPSRLHVSTIHGILALFLKKYSVELHLSPDFSFLSMDEDLKVRKKTLKNLIIQNPQLEELFDSYNQKDILYFLDLAMQKKVLHPTLKAFSESELKQQAIQELKIRAKALVQSAQQIIDSTTLPKWQEYMQSIYRLKSENIFNQDPLREISLFLESLGRRPSFKKEDPPFDEDLLKEFGKNLDWFKKHEDHLYFHPTTWKKMAEMNEKFNFLFEAFSEHYLNEKIQSSQILMSDLENFSYQILKKKPELGKEFSQEWDYWMIDEYQDTSPLQVELLHHLIGNRPQFVVGDPQQSIYFFRGAQTGVFEEKSKEIEKLRGELKTQFSNYRSRQELLHFLNDFFSGRTEPFEKMKPEKSFASAEAVATFVVAEEDQEIIQAKNRILDLLNKNVKPEDICVLSRTHKSLEELSQLLKQEKVPFEVIGTSEFKNRREVLDILHFIRFLVNPHDNKNFISLLRTPSFYIDDQFIVDMVEQAAKSKKDSYWKQSFETIVSPMQKTILEKLENYLFDFYSQGLGATLKKFFQASGIIESSFQKDPSGRQEANLWKLYSKVIEAESQGSRELLNLIQTLNADDEDQSMDQEVVPLLEPARVHLMTVHASKGLQFSHVILLGVAQDQQKSKNSPWSCDDKGRFSLSLRSSEDQSWIHPVLASQLTEEKNKQEQKESYRVMYVALTRAKESVTLILNQKAGNSSWQNLMPWNLEKGRHSTANYFYDVIDQAALSDESLRRFHSAQDLAQTWPDQYQHQARGEQVATSPTKMIEIHGDKKISSQDQRLKVLKKVQRGVSYHRLFESLKYLSNEEIKALITSSADQEVLRFVTETKSLPLLEIIQNGYAEWGFELQTRAGLLRGQIDLWGIVGDQAWIVDYKTGSMEYKDKAFEQLKIYADSLQLMKKIKPAGVIQLAVVYPFDQKVLVQPYKTT